MPPEKAYEDLLGSAVPVVESLAQLVILAMILERGLSFVFDSHWFKVLAKDRDGWKSPITLAVSWGICCLYHFDVLSVVFRRVAAEPIGIFLTAGGVAGGSAG